MNQKILKSLLIYIALIHPAVFSQNYIETYEVTDFMDKPYMPQQYTPYADEEIEREAEMIAAAKADEKSKVWLDGKTIVKEIAIPGKLVNFVVK